MKDFLRRAFGFILAGVFALLAMTTSIMIMNADNKSVALSGSDYTNCLNTSGGRSHIDSVQWACEHTEYTGWSYACALWLGSSNSTETRIYVSDGASTVDAYYYGMCTNDTNGNSHSTAAVDVYVITGDNGSIGSASRVSRGRWGSSLSGTRTSVNVSKFISGINPVSTASGLEYTRNVDINRCNAENTSSCDDQWSTITLILNEPKYRLIGRSVNKNGSSLSHIAGLYDKYSAEVKSGGYASVTRGYNSNYVFKGWRDSPTGSYISYNDTYGTTLYSNKTVYAVYEEKYSLTAKSVDVNGNSLASVAGLGDRNSGLVDPGSWAEVSHGSNSNYVFHGWKSSPTGSYISTAATYGTTLNSNVTVYAVFEQKYSLTAKSVDIYGASLAGIAGLGDKNSGLVNPGAWAEVTRGTNSNYTFRGWKSSPTAGSYISTAATYGTNLTRNVTVYAVYERKYKITAKSIDIYGNSLASISGLEDKYSSLVDGGTEASVRRGSAVGYVFRGWKESPSSSTYLSKEDVFRKVIYSDYTVYVEYEKNEIHGKVDTLIGSTNSSTGYTPTSKNVTYDYVDCDVVNGCEVKFTHYMKRISGIETPAYSVRRSSNYSGSGVNSTTLARGTFVGNSGEEKRIHVDTIKMYPGQTVCETLSFPPYTEGGDINITSCVLALGDAQPRNPDGSSSLIDIDVKNNSVSKYNSYQKIIYAKPRDSVTFMATYTPTLQYTYIMSPAQMRITCINNGATNTVGPYNNTSSQTFQTMFNTYKSYCSSDLRDWNNAFGIIKTNFNSLQSSDLNYSIGIGRPAKVERTNDYTVTSDNVGKEVKETAQMNASLNTGANVKSSPTQISFTNNNGANVGNVIIGNDSSSAKIVVPYNYDTEISIDNDDDDKVVSAGGTVGIGFIVRAVDKNNEQTTNDSSEKYHTKIDQAKTKIIVYITPLDGEDPGINSYGGNPCAYFETNRDAQTCNETPGNTGDSITITDSYSSGRRTFDVPDIDAGLRICLAAGVYPANSGDDTNTNASGSDSWRISKSKCHIIGKKPTFQVWGGSLYSYGNVKSNATMKKVLADADLKGNYLAVSPWAEYSVISNGSVSGLASAAATGLMKDKGNIMAGNIEKSDNNNFCRFRIFLSIANDAGNSSRVPSMCKNGKQVSGNSGIVTDSVDIDSIISSLEVYQVRHAADNSPNKVNIIIDNNNGNLEIGYTDVPLGTNMVWQRVNDTITITGDIVYDKSSYISLNKIPKAIIYAKNINILCSVKEVDAILVAKDTINTCTGVSNDTQDDINSEIRSTLLKINGAVVADRLLLNRTYGVGSGYASAIPAEIINYDSSIVEWRRNMLNISGFNTLSTVYQNELAPRY